MSFIGGSTELTSIQESYDKLRVEFDKLQSSLSEKQLNLERSREDYSLLSQTNQSLQQAIVLLEDEKTQYTIEMAQLEEERSQTAQLMQDKRTLEEDKANLIRERDQLRVQLVS